MSMKDIVLENYQFSRPDRHPTQYQPIKVVAESVYRNVKSPLVPNFFQTSYPFDLPPALKTKTNVPSFSAQYLPNILLYT